MWLALAFALLQAPSPAPVANDEALRRTVADRGEWKIQSLMFSYDGE